MKKIYLHPLPLRIWHWVNALLVILLIITGIQLRIPGIAALQPHNTPLLIHRWVGWAMAASCVFWLVYSLKSDHLSRNYVIRRRHLKGTFRQARFYLFSMFKGEENPFRPSAEEKFNLLQKLAYGAIMASSRRSWWLPGSCSAIYSSSANIFCFGTSWGYSTPST